jgi:hypothetical protein
MVMMLKIYRDAFILPIAVAHWVKPIGIRLGGAHQRLGRWYWRAFGKIVWRFDMGGAAARHFVDPDYWEASNISCSNESRESSPKSPAFRHAVRRLNCLMAYCAGGNRLRHR